MCDMEKITREPHKASLIAEITAAFDGVARGNGVTMSEAEELAYFPSTEELAAARAMDTELRWQDVSAERIARCPSALHYLDPAGFRYYIPAYLIWYLTFESEEESMTYDYLTFFLDSDFEAEENKAMRTSLSLLTPEQSKAIASFCVFAAADIEQASAEIEARLDGWVAQGQWAQEERDAGREASHQFAVEHDVPGNQYQRALDRYWGQFL
jgi:hypothetical protein